MKFTYYATAFSIGLLLSTTAHAGSFEEGTDDAPIIGEGYSVVSFGGFYAGGSIGQMRQTQRTSQSEGYRRACVSSNHEKHRWAGKCEVSQSDWETSPELLALGAPVQGHPSGEDANTRAVTDFRYHADQSGGLADGKYPGVWVSEQSGRLEYKSQTDNGETREWGNYATNEFLGEVFSVATSEDTATSYGVHAGYRIALSDNLYVGGELSAVQGDVLLATAEAQAGVSWGNMLGYGFIGAGQYDGDDATVYGGGLDVMIGNGWLVGGKVTLGDDIANAGLRVSRAW